MYRPFLARIFAAALILCLALPGCSKKLTRQKDLTEATLFARGQQMEAKKKFKEAAEAFRLLVERYPNSPLAPQGQFGLASSLLQIKNLTEAEIALDDFLRLYPANPKVADVLFLKANLLQQQIMPPGRSQDKTREAIETFKLFLEKEQGTERAETAAADIKKLRLHLVRHEEEIVSHLLARKQYESAELHVKRVIKEYPDAAPTDRLLSMLDKAIKRQGNKAAEQAHENPDEKLTNDGSK